MPTKKRLLFFDVITHFGGAQRSTVLLCERLRAHYDVHILDAYGVCERYREAVKAIGVPYEVVLPSARNVYIGHKGRLFRRLMKAAGQIPEMWTLKTALRKAINRLGPDLVWTNSPKALFFLKLAGVRRICPVVFYARGWYRKSEISSVGRFLVNHVARHVFTLSQATADAMGKWYRHRDRIHVVYNTVDIEQIQSTNHSLVSMPPKHDRAIKILIPAHLLPTKGQHTAIEAAAHLKDKGIDFVLWLAGDTGTLDKKNRYYESLQALVHRYDLEDYVVFLGYRSDVPALMKAADVILLPTHSEGFCRAALEAMILKKIVIATPAGGILDLIDDGQTGLVVPFDNPEKIAEHIERLSENDTIYQDIIEKGHAHALKIGDPTFQVALVEQAIERIISVIDKRCSCE